MEGLEGKPALTFLWKIEDFSFFVQEIAHCISSPIFKIDSLEFFLQLFISRYDEQRSSDLKVCLKICRNRVNSILSKSQFQPSPSDLKACLSRWKERANSILLAHELAFLTVDDSPHVTPKVSCTIHPGKSLQIKDCPTWQDLFVTRRPAFLPQDTLTLRLRVWLPEQVVVKFHQCSAVTTTVLKRRTKLFYKPDFISQPMDKDIPMEASSPFDYDDSNTIMTLKFSNNGENTQNMVVGVQVDANCFDKDLFCRISVVDRFKKRVLSQQKFDVANSNIHYFEFTKFVSRNKLVDRKSDLLPDGVLSLICELYFLEIGLREKSDVVHQIPDDTKITKPETSEPVVETASSSVFKDDQLRDNLLSLYKKKTFCDFELRTGNVSFPVHMSILSARSPVFEALFSGNMKEMASAVQDIPDMDADTLDGMLVFIYTGIVTDMRKRNVAKLYYASDKYKLPTLKRKCSLFLAANVNLSNVCELLQLAHQHSDDHLLSSVHNFLIENMDQTIPSDEWKDFMARNVQVAAETLCVLFSKVDIKKI